MNKNNIIHTAPVLNPNDNTEELRQNIRIAALKLLYHNGYNAVTLKNISEIVDLELSDISELYSSQVEILTDVIQWAIKFGNTLGAELELITDPHVKIEKYIIFHFAFLDSNPAMATLLLADESISGSRRIESKLRQLRSHRIGLLKSILEDGKNDSQWVSDDAEQMTLLILGYMRMKIASWKQSNKQESLYVYGKTAARFILEILALKTRNN